MNSCPNCGGANLFRAVKPVSAGGGYAPDLLNGLGTWLSSAKADIVVCEDCGLMRQFASTEARAKLATSKKWERI
ncbi:MAG: hypothetical protein WEF86_01245 [Gemmatimonadota bacterium]